MRTATSARTVAFDSRSTGRSLQLWASQHHGVVYGLSGAAAAGAVACGAKLVGWLARQ